ncbi:MAG: metallophosphoesterase [Burkholderiales bacterium]|nr:metallophosphoesterase [Burkholderiales bacterium]
MHATLPETPLDLIGDIHGEHDALRALLLALEYDDEGRHPQGRRLVFVGDLCDRGPDSPGVVARVRRLVQSGRAQAILGNHELNLLRAERKVGNDWFWSENAHHDNRFTPFAWADAAQREDMLAFFESLPLTLARDDLRVVHAAWHTPSVERLSAIGRAEPLGRLFDRLDIDVNAAMDADGSRARSRGEKSQWRHLFADPGVRMPMLRAVGESEARRQTGNPIRVLTSGVERCADEPFFASGQWRFAERVAWWDDYQDDTPVVVGHYWRQFLPLDRAELGKGDADLFDRVAPTAWHGRRGNVFCIDYSVGGRYQERSAGKIPGERTRLGALRWPERELVLDTGERMPTTGFARNPGG